MRPLVARSLDARPIGLIRLYPGFIGEEPCRSHSDHCCRSRVEIERFITWVIQAQRPIVPLMLEAPSLAIFPRRNRRIDWVDFWRLLRKIVWIVECNLITVTAARI